MAQQVQPSYTDLVYDVLKAAGRPLTVPEIVDAVNRRRPITTRNPKGTVRSALSAGGQLIGTGGGRYGYLPNLLQGSLLRLSFTEPKPANHPLILSDEVHHALCPSFFESQKRSERGPVRLSLPNGDDVTLQLQLLGTGIWGSQMPEGLRRYLVKNHASEGDSLLIRVVDAREGRYEGRFEAKRQRDSAAVARRNQELADAAFEIIGQSPSHAVANWDLACRVLARGFYKSDAAPESIKTVLSTDGRFRSSSWGGWMRTDRLTRDDEAWIGHWQKGEDAIVESEQADLENALGGPSLSSSRISMERSNRDIQALLTEHNFESIEDANAFLQSALTTGTLPHRVGETPLAQAQDLMYDAWETSESRDRIRLARKALLISPDCADAYVLLAEETARTPKEAVDLYAQGVAAGERALGPGGFEQDVGEFWGLIETRPYMRARLGLALTLWAMGKRPEAIGHAWDMLRLNPNDNQGVRYLLLSWLLDVGDHGELTRLLDLYPDDGSASWLYGRALDTFATEGASGRARVMLLEAIAANRHVPDYLLGKRRLPRELPPYIGIGDVNEAVDCAAGQMAAWRRTPGAQAWLAAL